MVSVSTGANQATLVIPQKRINHFQANKRLSATNANQEFQKEVLPTSIQDEEVSYPNVRQLTESNVKKINPFPNMDRPGVPS